MMMRSTRNIAMLLVMASLVAPPGGGAQETIFDIAGRRIGALPSGVTATGPGSRVRLLPGGEAFDGRKTVRFGAGYYVLGGAPGDDSASGFAGEPAGYGTPLANLFKDGTLEHLPLREWDLADVETGDLNGDGLDDIVFSLRWNDCDSIPGTRPRVWIQNSAGRFTDETNTRMPDVSTSTFDIDLFDADGDGDPDILLGGYSCGPTLSPATLLINDGNGVFTDETADRLIGVPEFTFLNYISQARIDSGDSQDIVAILFDVRQGIAYPYLFLNTGDGHFWPDLYGRLLGFRSYGFFNVEARDLTADGLDDLLFLNIAYPDNGRAGGLALFRNAGNGFFADETAARLGNDTLRSTRDVAMADADADGDPDILDVGWFYGENNPQLRLLTNDGSGNFEAGGSGDLAGTTGWFNDAEFALFSNATLPDIFIAKIVVQSYSEDVLLLNRGGGAFRDSSELLPSVIDFSVAISTFDYNRDGDPDIVVGNSNPVIDLPGQNRLYINQRLSPPAAVEGPGGIPLSASLIGNYPNPFNPSTVIRYALDAAADVTLVAVNVLGEVVMRTDAGRQSPGTHELRWDAAGLPGGVYWYSLFTGGRRVATRPALLVR
jgi:hypothetical protein